MMKLLPRVAIAGLTVVFVASCSSMLKREVSVNEVNNVKTAAVIIYTVPTKIEHRDNPRVKNSDGLLSAVMKMSARASSKEAATLAHKTFSETLQKQNLPFKVISRKKIMSNKKFIALRSTIKAKPKEEKNALTSALSFIGGSTSSKLTGKAPEKMVEFGLTPWGSKGSALIGTPEEKKYIMAAIKALKVDAAIVVVDPGYSFSCEVCIGGSGAASTGSAFSVSMIDKNGKEIVALDEWFATTDAQAAMVSGAVNPLQHASLFEEHGRKLATVFVGSLNEALNKK
jgi:hypothetical protein